MTDNYELKACPFCGGQALHCDADLEGVTVHMICCEDCGITTPCSENIDEVAALWNNRV